MVHTVESDRRRSQNVNFQAPCINEYFAIRVNNKWVLSIAFVALKEPFHHYRQTSKQAIIFVKKAFVSVRTPMRLCNIIQYGEA